MKLSAIEPKSHLAFRNFLPEKTLFPLVYLTLLLLFRIGERERKRERETKGGLKRERQKSATNSSSAGQG